MVDGMLPSQYDDTFKSCGAKYGIDWRLLKALCASESSFRSNVDLKYGVGLMGVNPWAHWKEAGFGTQVDYRNALIKDPKYNICEGARIYSDIRRRFQERLAIAHYKGYTSEDSPNAVKRIDIVYHYLNDIKMTEHI